VVRTPDFLLLSREDDLWSSSGGGEVACRWRYLFWWKVSLWQYGTVNADVVHCLIAGVICGKQELVN
jgi:hypothetical protein